MKDETIEVFCWGAEIDEKDLDLFPVHIYQNESSPFREVTLVDYDNETCTARARVVAK